jgi:hypothetical protein
MGDGDIICLFAINDVKKSIRFGDVDTKNSITDQCTYGNVRIYKPDGSRCVFTEKFPIDEDGKLQVLFSYENIDHFTEVGTHKLQIHLYDDNDPHDESKDKNRFTIPPVDLHVLMPIGEDNSQINEAKVGYSMLTAIDEEVPTFDDNGNYNKTVWENGDIITQNKLNKLEDALYQVIAADDNFITNEGLEVALANKADALHVHNANEIAGLANVAKTGSYNDLTYKPDLTSFATKSELSEKANMNHPHSEYATRSELEGKSNKGHTHDNYALKTDLSAIPTKVSDLDNDKVFITREDIPSWYVTEDDLDDYKFATRNYVDGNFASQGYVDRKILEAQIPTVDGSNINLSGYAKKEDIPLYTSDLINDSRFISSSFLIDYATINYVNNTIDDRLGDFDPDIQLENYPTFDDMNGALADKADKEHEHLQYSLVDHRHDDVYALKEEIPELVVIPENISAFKNDKGYLTESEVDAKIDVIELTPGPQGEQGPQGEVGPIGPQGERGERGPEGPAGQNGQDGKDFTYDMFTDEQLDALIGPRGPQGDQGIQGPQGPEGPAGKDGVDGTVTFDELTDAQREMIRGPQGIQGPQGDKGDKGDAFTYKDLTPAQKADLTQDFITSNIITSIQIVDILPDKEDPNVLYIVRE